MSVFLRTLVCCFVFLNLIQSFHLCRYCVPVSSACTRLRWTPSQPLLVCPMRCQEHRSHCSAARIFIAFAANVCTRLSRLASESGICYTICAGVRVHECSRGIFDQAPTIAYERSTQEWHVPVENRRNIACGTSKPHAE